MICLCCYFVSGWVIERGNKNFQMTQLALLPTGLHLQHLAWEPVWKAGRVSDPSPGYWTAICPLPRLSRFWYTVKAKHQNHREIGLAAPVLPGYVNVSWQNVLRSILATSEADFPASLETFFHLILPSLPFPQPQRSIRQLVFRELSLVLGPWTRVTLCYLQLGAILLPQPLQC